MSVPPPESPPPDLATALAAGMDVVAMLNRHRGTFDLTMGLSFTRVTADALEAEVPITEALLQPYGLVHGGVYASIVETMASAASALVALPRGQSTVGLENSTSFLRAARSGTLHARATPEHRGGRSQVWSVHITDDQGRAIAIGRVRTLCLEPGQLVAGEALSIRGG